MSKNDQRNKGVGDYVGKAKAEDMREKEETKIVAPEGVGDGAPTPIPAAKVPAQSIVTQKVVGTDEDMLVSGIIAGAGAVDEEEWEKTYLDIKSRGNYFDLIRNMYPLHLPEVCEKMQEAKQKRYGWIGKENMEIKCEPSRIFYWTPVNRSNHPEVPAHLFNKHGGLMREGMYLCYMPWKMYAARCEMQEEANRVKYSDYDELMNRENEFAAHFDPTQGGTRGGGRPGDVVVETVDPIHPDDSYKEAGDYE